MKTITINKRHIMNFKLTPSSRCMFLAAGLLFGAAAAQAASGFTVSENRETLIKEGMSTTEVQQALGRPAQMARFGNEPGPTWTYNVIGSPYPMAVFEVDFSADGKVVSTTEREQMIR
jgi:outer membrane protein assembly factor BamE (lipoprotein component of BamABCDE complex)